MRLSPKSVFFGIVAVGLPVALTVGWMLGTPAPARPVASAPGGAGGMGAAPQTALVTSQPVTPVGYTSRPPRPGVSPSTAPSTAPVSAAPPVSPPPMVAPAASSAPPPSLDLPPVPTPTQVIVPPDSPSATPSESPSAQPSSGDQAELARTQ